MQEEKPKKKKVKFRYPNETKGLEGPKTKQWLEKGKGFNSRDKGGTQVGRGGLDVGRGTFVLRTMRSGQGKL